MIKNTKSKKLKRQRKHGFRARMKTNSMRNIIKSRRRKGKSSLSI